MASVSLEDSPTPLVHVFGENSKIMQRAGMADPDGLLKGIRKVVIPDSEHHIMVDQPLALVSAIRALLISWP
jgi:pimeloyl-ACP methyl ester carboxylesterase